MGECSRRPAPGRTPGGKEANKKYRVMMLRPSFVGLRLLFWFRHERARAASQLWAISGLDVVGIRGGKRGIVTERFPHGYDIPRGIPDYKGNS